jgi:hypothetical protein
VVPFVVPAVLATGVWGHTAAGLVDQQIQLRAQTDRAFAVATPAQTLISRLQEERRLTAVWQASRTGPTRRDLAAARERTDAAAASYRTRSSSGLDTPELTSAGEELDKALGNLAVRREWIDARKLSAANAFEYFTDAVTESTNVVAASLRSEDGSLSRAGTATTAVIRLAEMLSREDALVSAALPSGRMSGATRARFLQFLAIQQELRSALTSRDLPAGGAASYGEVADSRQWTSVGALEDGIGNASGTRLPRRAPTWPDSAERVVGDLQTLGADSLRGVGESASDRADELLLGLLLGTAATLAALVGGALLALRGRRATVDRIAALQQKTEELSGIWLPQLLSRIERGERIAPQPVAPQRHHTTDEMERLGSAIDHLGRVAADTAVRQNLGREGTEKVFAQLIRRTQVLIHRLISLLDELERKHEDADLLKDLFRVDHLATRVRRHAENLVILSGSPPSHRRTAPVSITDVMRSAVAETETYTRVKVKNVSADRPLALAGRAVADVTHLLAELVENGTSFSPPDTQVFISATKVAKGLAIHVEDHGLGMPVELREQANELLAHPPKLDMRALGEDPRLGHFVVARLAERYKIKVELRESVYGGILVVVLLPAELLEEMDTPVLDQLRSAAAAANRAVGGRRERPCLGAGGPAEAGGSSAVAGAALAGAGAGPAGGTVSAGTAVGSAFGGEVLTHTRMPDQGGFPEYGGAGLLAPVPDSPSFREPDTTRWMPQEHPGPRAHHAEPGARGGRPGAEAGTGAAPLRDGGGPVAQQDTEAGSGAGGDAGPGTTVISGRVSGTGRGAELTPGIRGARPGGGEFPRPAPSPAAEPRQNPSGPLTTPAVLPQRTRGASLAQQLRKEATHQSKRGSGRQPGFSPDASARTMTAIQRGLERARLSDGEPDLMDGRETPPPPRDPGAP